MPILLETIAQPGATPVANRTSSAKSFANDYFKLANDTTSPRDRRTIEILGLIYELTSKAGANYKLNHRGLIKDATVWTAGISLFDISIGMAAVDWGIGKVADGTLSADIPTLLKEGADLAMLPEEILDRIITFLNAQLQV